MGFSSAWRDTQECQAQDCGTHACCTVRRAGKSGLCFLMQDSNAAEYGRGGDSKAREDEEKEDK